MTNFADWTGPDAPDGSSHPQLTTLEAFDAMRLFVENYWERGGKGSDELRLLLSAMNRDTAMWTDGGPADPAMWSDWLHAVGRVKSAED